MKAFAAVLTLLSYFLLNSHCLAQVLLTGTSPCAAVQKAAASEHACCKEGRNAPKKQAHSCDGKLSCCSGMDVLPVHAAQLQRPDLIPFQLSICGRQAAPPALIFCSFGNHGPPGSAVPEAFSTAFGSRAPPSRA